MFNEFDTQTQGIKLWSSTPSKIIQTNSWPESAHCFTHVQLGRTDARDDGRQALALQTIWK